MNEVEALFELYKKLSCSIIDDGLIHKVQFLVADIFSVFLLQSMRKNLIFFKSNFVFFNVQEELQLALLKTSSGENLFVDRVSCKVPDFVALKTRKEKNWVRFSITSNVRCCHALGIDSFIGMFHYILGLILLFIEGHGLDPFSLHLRYYGRYWRTRQ